MWRCPGEGQAEQLDMAGGRVMQLAGQAPGNLRALVGPARLRLGACPAANAHHSAGLHMAGTTATARRQAPGARVALPQLLLRGVVAGQGTCVHQVLRDGAHGGGHDGGCALSSPLARVRR